MFENSSFLKNAGFFLFVESIIVELKYLDIPTISVIIVNSFHIHSQSSFSVSIISL